MVTGSYFSSNSNETIAANDEQDKFYAAQYKKYGFQRRLFENNSHFVLFRDQIGFLLTNVIVRS